MERREPITLTLDASTSGAMVRAGALAQLEPRALFPSVVGWPVAGFLVGVMFRAPFTGVLLAVVGYLLYLLHGVVGTARNIAAVVKPGVAITSTRDTDGSVELTRTTGSTSIRPGEFSDVRRHGAATVLHARRGGNLVVASALLTDDDVAALTATSCTGLARRLTVTPQVQRDVFRALGACVLASPLGWVLITVEIAGLVVLGVPGILDTRSWATFATAVLVVPAAPLLLWIGVRLQFRVGVEIGAELDELALVVDVPHTRSPVPYARMGNVKARHRCVTFQFGFGWTVLPEALVTTEDVRGRLPAKVVPGANDLPVP